MFLVHQGSVEQVAVETVYFSMTMEVWLIWTVL